MAQRGCPSSIGAFSLFEDNLTEEDQEGSEEEESLDEVEMRSMISGSIQGDYLSQ